jgi:hypothetical protein
MGVLTFQMTKRQGWPSEQVQDATIFVQVDFDVIEDVAGPVVEGRAFETLFRHIRPSLEQIARTKMDRYGADASESIRITLHDLERFHPPEIGLVDHAPYSGPSSSALKS